MPASAAVDRADDDDEVLAEVAFANPVLCVEVEAGEAPRSGAEAGWKFGRSVEAHRTVSGDWYAY
jgi:hypothetical protein